MSIGHHKEIRRARGRERRQRPKSFTTEEKAHESAKKQKLSKYKIIKPNNGLSNKFMIVKE